jgi:hypothetical protein
MGNSRIQFRRGRASGWDQENPILHDGEPGYERDTKKFKIGDGETHWRDLDYVDLGDEDNALAAITAHLEDETPHPVYDDGPSLDLLYQNAKV